MKHCQNCNRDYSDKYFRKHCRSNNRSKKRLELNINTKQKNILVNEVDNTLTIIVDKHKRKPLSFLFVCKLNIKKIIGYPKRVFLKYYDKVVKINVDFKFYSNREDMSINYDISQPEPMLEPLIIKNLDKYQEKLKILEHSRAPYYGYLIPKYYEFAIIDPANRLVFCVRGGWLNNSPTEPNNDFKEISRN